MFSEVAGYARLLVVHGTENDARVRAPTAKDKFANSCRIGTAYTPTTRGADKVTSRMRRVIQQKGCMVARTSWAT
jgi:hypothetical protein